MNYSLSLTNKNSNEIYTVSLPKNLVNFIRYDFTVFMERSIDLCKFYLKTGDFRVEEVTEIRNSISGCHKYFEHNIRTTFDKIVIDCWIEYLCRQNEIGTMTLWNNFMQCKNSFERAVFARLNEYRHNQAINQWVNILKIQEYATRKVDFVFGKRVKSVSEAIAKANYFDLMFNVTANELGYDIENVAQNRVYSSGRTPNSPFTMSHISREIIRNVLSDLKYTASEKISPRSQSLSDQTAMDAFTSMKAFLPSEPDNIIETMIKTMESAPQRVYITDSFKGVVDLEIDALIQAGGVLAKCGRCGDYFLRDDDYPYDYCDRINRNGTTCLQQMNVKVRENKPTKIALDTSDFTERCDQLYKEMSDRLNVDMTQRDFSHWYKYLSTMRENVLSGKATMEDFDNFVEYSRAMNFGPATPKSAPQVSENAQKSIIYDDHGREVKPFVFEKIDRESLGESEGGLFEQRKSHAKAVEEPHSTHIDKLEREPVNTTKIIRGYIAEEEEKSVPNRTTTIYTEPVESVTLSNLPNSNPSKTSSFSDYAEDFSDAPQTPQAVLDNVMVEDEVDDVKIYNYDPVKVYNPGANRKKRRSTVPSKIELKPSGGAAREPAPVVVPTPLRQPQVVDPSYDDESEFVNIDENPAPAPAILRPPVEEIKTANTYNRQTVRREERSSSAVRSYLHTAGDLGGVTNVRKPAQEQQAAPVERDAKRSSRTDSIIQADYDLPEPVSPPPSQERPKTFRLDVGDEVGFTDVLKGFERSDGFESADTQPHGDEPPVSHKTKRVMDAILKPSKPSFSINVNKNDE